MELGELYICRRSVAYDMRLLLKLTFVLVLEAMKALEFRLTFLDEIYKVHDIKNFVWYANVLFIFLFISFLLALPSLI